ncbi:MAG: Asp23/Gls24 family envelope stress response protein [bacterium]|nr:Asp23/Gls24 family envelope stress response protein [bacterium]
MDKDMEKGTYVLQEDNSMGTVKIADDVVAMIAGLAASEVEGVSAMVGNITNELMSRVGMTKLTKGVKVEITGREVRADIAVVLEYGYNIPATSQKVQEKVKTAIENMTGLVVSDVNIRIAGVNMQKSK